MPQNPKQKTIQLESHLTLSTTVLKSPMGMKISPKTFRIIQWNRTGSPQNTALIQKKYLNWKRTGIVVSLLMPKPL